MFESLHGNNLCIENSGATVESFECSIQACFDIKARALKHSLLVAHYVYAILLNDSVRRRQWLIDRGYRRSG